MTNLRRKLMKTLLTLFVLLAIGCSDGSVPRSMIPYEWDWRDSITGVRECKNAGGIPRISYSHWYDKWEIARMGAQARKKGIINA